MSKAKSKIQDRLKEALDKKKLDQELEQKLKDLTKKFQDFIANKDKIDETIRQRLAEAVVQLDTIILTLTRQKLALLEGTSELFALLEDINKLPAESLGVYTKTTLDYIIKSTIGYITQSKPENKENPTVSTISLEEIHSLVQSLNRELTPASQGDRQRLITAKLPNITAQMQQFVANPTKPKLQSAKFMGGVYKLIEFVITNPCEPIENFSNVAIRLQSAIATASKIQHQSEKKEDKHRTAQKASDEVHKSVKQDEGSKEQQEKKKAKQKEKKIRQKEKKAKKQKGNTRPDHREAHQGAGAGEQIVSVSAVAATVEQGKPASAAPKAEPKKSASAVHPAIVLAAQPALAGESAPAAAKPQTPKHSEVLELTSALPKAEQGNPAIAAAAKAEQKKSASAAHQAIVLAAKPESVPQPAGNPEHSISQVAATPAVMPQAKSAPVHPESAPAAIPIPAALAPKPTREPTATDTRNRQLTSLQSDKTVKIYTAKIIRAGAGATPAADIAKPQLPTTHKSWQDSVAGAVYTPQHHSHAHNFTLAPIRMGAGAGAQIQTPYAPHAGEWIPHIAAGYAPLYTYAAQYTATLQVQHMPTPPSDAGGSVPYVAASPGYPPSYSYPYYGYSYIPQHPAMAAAAGIVPNVMAQPIPQPAPYAAGQAPYVAASYGYAPQYPYPYAAPYPAASAEANPEFTATPQAQQPQTESRAGGEWAQRITARRAAGARPQPARPESQAPHAAAETDVGADYAAPALNSYLDYAHSHTPQYQAVVAGAGFSPDVAATPQAQRQQPEPAAGGELAQRATRGPLGSRPQYVRPDFTASHRAEQQPPAAHAESWTERIGAGGGAGYIRQA